MAKQNHNVQDMAYQGMLRFRQSHPLSEEELEKLKEDFQKYVGPIMPADKDVMSVAITGYVTRDMSGRLRLYHSHPSMAINYNYLPDNMFPEIQYNSDPLHVKIEITPIYQ